MSKLQIAGVVLAVLVIIGVGFYFGNLRGQQVGYEEAVDFYEPKMADLNAQVSALVKRYNDLVASSNQSIDRLEKQAAQAADQNAKLKKDYAEALKAITLSDSEKNRQAFSAEMAKQINEVIK